MMKLLTTIFVLLPTLLFAQRGLQYPYWSAKVIASSSSFLSDLGGKNAIGTNDPSDLDFNSTRFALGAGLQYNSGAFGIGVNSFYTRLVADDQNTAAKSRNVRNLHVFTDLVEANLMIELTVPQRVPVLGNFYVNFGAGFIYYEPKAIYNGQMYKLRYLGTEGQNYLPGAAPYSPYSPVIPFGFGKKIQLNNGSRLCLDVSLRKSFTDYLDDVSTVYANPAKVAELGGEAAGYFANPGTVQKEPGMQRGDPKNMDNYFLIGFKYEIPLSQFGKDFNTVCAFATNWTNYKSAPRYNRRGKMRR